MKALILATALALAALPALSGACSKTVPPVKLSVLGIALSEVSYRLITVDVGFHIANPRDVPAVMDRMEYDIYFGHKDKWIWLGRGSQTGTEIGPGGTVDFTIETRIENSPFVRKVTEAIFGTEPTQMKIEGRASFTLGESVFEVRFHRKVSSTYDSPVQSQNPPGSRGQG